MHRGTGAKASVSPARRGALSRNLHHVERLAGSHEQAIALGTAKTDVRAHFRQTNPSDQLGRRIKHQDAGIAERRARAAPQMPGNVRAHAIRPAFDAIYSHVGEQPLIDDFGALHVKGIDISVAAGPGVARALASADHVKGLVVG
jgi:hypothetical protein